MTADNPICVCGDPQSAHPGGGGMCTKCTCDGYRVTADNRTSDTAAVIEAAAKVIDAAFDDDWGDDLPGYLARALASAGLLAGDTRRDAQAIDPELIAAQREKGWVDFHPEDFCHKCGTRNVHAWSAPNDLWDQVCDQFPTSHIVCPQCFTEAVNALGRSIVWRLAPTDTRHNTIIEAAKVEVAARRHITHALHHEDAVGYAIASERLDAAEDALAAAVDALGDDP